VKSKIWLARVTDVMIERPKERSIRKGHQPGRKEKQGGVRRDEGMDID